jgi:hypothetical protein
VDILNAARVFYAAFFLAHAEKLTERISYYPEQDHEMRERVISMVNDLGQLLTPSQEDHTGITTRRSK